MTEISKTRNQGRLRWKSALVACVLFGLGGCLRGGNPSIGALWPDIAGHFLIGLVFGAFGFGLVAASQWLLDGPEVWTFDDEGYRHSRQSKLWPAVRRVSYADVARIHVTRLPDGPAFALTLGLRSGKTVRIGAVWDEMELTAIRDLLAARMPGSALPLPA
jgi:hypothetical protein